MTDKEIMDIKNYTKQNVTIAVLGSHSALDVCRGAKDEGFKTLVIIEKGRGKTYEKYYATRHSEERSDVESLAMDSGLGESGMTTLGCVDEVLEVEKFKDILSEEIQQKLLKRNSIFIPHRSFEVYLNDYDAIENKFKVPMFGNRKLLRFEERSEKPNQYDLLDKAGIRYPKLFDDPSKIDRLVIVKVSEKERGYERAFFLAKDEASFKRTGAELIEAGKITEEVLKNAVIEEFITGVQVNFNFFYDPINKRLELLGTDTRRQTNLEGILKLPASSQDYLLDNKFVEIKYEEAGHIAVTVLESMLEKAFEIGERFVEATQKSHIGSVIGPFGLQSMIIPGPPKKDIIVFDVSPRMPGSPGIAATPYSGYLFGKNISAGRRVAMEIKQALEENKLMEVLT